MAEDLNGKQLTKIIPAQKSPNVSVFHHFKNGLGMTKLCSSIQRRCCRLWVSYKVKEIPTESEKETQWTCLYSFPSDLRFTTGKRKICPLTLTCCLRLAIRLSRKHGMALSVCSSDMHRFLQELERGNGRCIYAVCLWASCVLVLRHLICLITSLWCPLWE